MRVNPSTVRGYFRQESRLVASLDQLRTPTPANGIPPVESLSPDTTVITPPAVSVRGQLTFYFYEPCRSPRLGRQTQHEMAIASWIVAENRYAPPLLHWAQRRLSLERLRAKQHARAEAARRKHEQQLELGEQRIATITRNLGVLVRKLDGLRFADTRMLAGITSELRRLAANEAPPQ